MHNDPSIRKLGSVCAILVGIAYVLRAITALLDPTQSADYPWQTLVQSPAMFLLSHSAIAFRAIFAFAAIPAIAMSLQRANKGWVQWMSRLAYLGFSVAALSGVQNASVDVTYFAIDPYSWLSTACIGVWLFAVNLLALRAGAWPKLLSWLGIVAAGTYWCALIGNIPGSPMPYFAATRISEFVLQPIWFVWIGLHLRRGETA